MTNNVILSYLYQDRSTLISTGISNFKYHVKLSNITAVFNCVNSGELDNFSDFRLFDL